MLLHPSVAMASIADPAAGQQTSRQDDEQDNLQGNQETQISLSYNARPAAASVTGRSSQNGSISAHQDLSWSVVLESIQNAKEDHDRNDSSRKIRNVAENKAVLQTLTILTDMIPDAYFLSILKGSLKLVFTVRQDIL